MYKHRHRPINKSYVFILENVRGPKTMPATYPLAGITIKVRPWVFTQEIYTWCWMSTTNKEVLPWCRTHLPMPPMQFIKHQALFIAAKTPHRHFHFQS
jgi:hypothetical protein